MDKRTRTLAISYRDIALFAVVSIPIGIAVGAIDALFGRILIAIGARRDAHVFALVPFFAVAGLAIVFAYARFGKNTARGMGLVFDVGHGREDDIPLRLLPLVMVSTWLTHLFGGSAGREGVAVQIGATLSHAVGRHLPGHAHDRTFLVVGMAAGFAGLFRTPLAATLFALEVLCAGRLEYRALAGSLAASFAASMTSGALGLSKFEVAVSAPATLDVHMLAVLALLGLVFGLVGGGFAWCLARAKALAATYLANPYMRIAIFGVALSVLLLAVGGGRYCGLGTNLISTATGTGQAQPIDWLLKFCFTIVTLSAGFQGGEVTPLFSIGASLGAVIALPLGISPVLAAALGYAAVFGSATNTLLAPILIGCEVFGCANLPAFFVVCCVAYLVNMNKSIYTGQTLLR